MSEEERFLAEIRGEFLAGVHREHAAHGFTTDILTLSKSLGIQIVPGQTNLAATSPAGPIIIIDEDQSERRKRFSAMHEIAHHLFERMDDGCLRAQLIDLYHSNRKKARDKEEELCDAAAGRLLMPEHRLEAAVGDCGYSPLAIVRLMKDCSASAAAAMRRVIEHYEVPSFGILLTPDGRVTDSVSHGHSKEYRIGYDFRLEYDHPLREKVFNEGVVHEFRSPVPFKSGNREWLMTTRACIGPGARTVAVFAKSF